MSRSKATNRLTTKAQQEQAVPQGESHAPPNHPFPPQHVVGEISRDFAVSPNLGMWYGQAGGNMNSIVLDHVKYAKKRIDDCERELSLARDRWLVARARITGISPLSPDYMEAASELNGATYTYLNLAQLHRKACEEA